MGISILPFEGVYTTLFLVVSTCLYFIPASYLSENFLSLKPGAILSHVFQLSPLAPLDRAVARDAGGAFSCANSKDPCKHANVQVKTGYIVSWSSGIIYRQTFVQKGQLEC